MQVFVAMVLVCASGLQTAPYSSKEGGFKIQFPAQPREMKSKTPNGDSTMYAAEKEGVRYAVSWIDLPRGSLDTAEKVEGYLDEVAKAFAKVASKIKSQEKITLDKHPGRELRAESVVGEMRVRWYLVNGRLFQVMLAGPATAVNSKNGDNFFASFAIAK
jgi:hypothetical protein